jgi:hypothetical protein
MNDVIEFKEVKSTDPRAMAALAALTQPRKRVGCTSFSFLFLCRSVKLEGRYTATTYASGIVLQDLPTSHG